MLREANRAEAPRWRPRSELRRVEWQRSLIHKSVFRGKRLWLPVIVAGLLSRGLAATEVCGTIRRAVDWTRENSPYIVTNDILIPPKARLSIEAGTVVQFAPPSIECSEAFPQEDWSDSQYVGIKVQGFLYVKGTEEEPVVFETQHFEKEEIGWDGIRVTRATKVSVQMYYAVLRGANRALNVKDSEFRISHNIFEYNNTGIYLGDYANLFILNNNFIHNKAAGVYISGANPHIMNNIIAYNNNYGIWSDSRAQVRISHNGFWQNTDGHCHRCPAGTLQFRDKPEDGPLKDEYHNIVASPLFQGSREYQAMFLKDTEENTPLYKVKDKNFARKTQALEKKIREGKGEKPFTPQGAGPYLLSKYSTYIDAGSPEEIFLDRDGTVNDLGIHGGKP